MGIIIPKVDSILKMQLMNMNYEISEVSDDSQ